ncbi:MAG: DnaD domain protein, partial [Eubacterium sp.]
MGELFLDGGMLTDTTSVSNIFIDKYMPKANGDFVKIYLHLLRMVSANSTNISLENIADVFNFTESDIKRALKYWEGLGLLSLVKGKNSSITGIKLEPCTYKEESGPVKRKYSAKDIDNFSKDEDISQLIFIAQTYMAKTLTANDTNTILFMVDTLNLSVDLVEYLIEYAVSTNHKSMHYIEKVALSLYDEGITSVTQAKQHLHINTAANTIPENYSAIFSAFGITGRK